MTELVTCEHLNNVVEVLVKNLWQSKEDLKCLGCGCAGPNLWICLQPNCLYIGCSESNNDHSTVHHTDCPTHSVHMNISTERVWCYSCQKEVHTKAAVQLVLFQCNNFQQRSSADTTGGSSSARSLGLSRGLGLNVSPSASAESRWVRRLANARWGDSAVGQGADDDEIGESDLDADCGDSDIDSRPVGLVGLQNIGNTCYMNAALQALSNTPPLTDYFLHCAASVAILAADKKPGLSRSYQKLMREIWNRKTKGYVVPNGILYGIRNVHPMFRGYHQHDTQEFLRCFMDQLHEELKEQVGGGMNTGMHSNRDSQTPASAGGDIGLVRRRTRQKSPMPNTKDEYTRTNNDLESMHRLDPRHIETESTIGKSSHRRSASYGGNPAGYYPLRQSDRAESMSETICRPQASGDEALSVVPLKRNDSLEGTAASEDEECYETCSSGATSTSDTCEPHSTTGGKQGCKRKNESPSHARSKHSVTSGQGIGDNVNSGSATQTEGITGNPMSTSGECAAQYRSVISDVFDGKLLSSVQCLTCDRISRRVETFQDLSLPIPSRDHIAVLRQQATAGLSNGPTGVQSITTSVLSCTDAYSAAVQDGWIWWLVTWLRSWFYGPIVSLHDCLAAFFSADELKGDNMYSCERCNKLRNGVKYSRVLRLPEVLCVHLKRFRHELMFSSKVGAKVDFPLKELDMRPYLHKECSSAVSTYELSAVICHAGTAGGGHYTCVARNAPAKAWYEFDDQCVTRLSPHQVQASEAYVLFYRKTNPPMALLRQRAREIDESFNDEENDIKFYVSRQWINKFNTWAEPGPVDNWDFVCGHGDVRPDRANDVKRLATIVSQQLWQFFYDNFGGGPACNHPSECQLCRRALERLRRRRARELHAFERLHALFQQRSPPPLARYALSMHWFRRWQAFVRQKTGEPPPPIDNSSIVISSNKQDGSSQGQQQNYVIKPGSDYAKLNKELWRFFHDIYGGGPEVKLTSEPTFTNQEEVARYPYYQSYATDVARRDSHGSVHSVDNDAYMTLPTRYRNYSNTWKYSNSDREDEYSLYDNRNLSDVDVTIQNQNPVQDETVTNCATVGSNSESVYPMSCDSDGEYTSNSNFQNGASSATHIVENGLPYNASYDSETDPINRDYDSDGSHLDATPSDLNRNKTPKINIEDEQTNANLQAVELPNLESISLRSKSDHIPKPVSPTMQTATSANCVKSATRSRRTRHSKKSATGSGRMPPDAAEMHGGDRHLVK